MGKNIDFVIDGHKIHLHPEKTALWKFSGDCYPIHIEIGATARCNQSCSFCALDFMNHKKIDINSQIMLNALEDMARPSRKYQISFAKKEETSIYRDSVKSVMFGGEGEPTLHKDLGLFVQRAKELGLDVSLTTNGVRFTRELQEQCLPYLSWIKFSVDAGTSKMYEQTHGVPKKQFEILMKNIADSVKLKKRYNLEATVGTQFLMLPENSNEQEARELVKRLEQINPGYLSVKPYSDHPLNHKELILKQKQHRVLGYLFKELEKDVDFKIEFRDSTRTRIEEGHNSPECYGLSFISLIDSKGNVLPCNLFYDKEEFIYGNLNRESFSKIWTGEKRQEILQKLKYKGLGECRSGCRCDASNRYLQRLVMPQAHDNFT